MGGREGAKRSFARRGRVLALLLALVWLAAPAVLAARPTGTGIQSAPAAGDGGDNLAQFRQKKLLALYLTAFILLLLAVLILIVTIRIRYKADVHPEATEELEDLWFKKEREDDT